MFLPSHSKFKSRWGREGESYPRVLTPPIHRRALAGSLEEWETGFLRADQDFECLFRYVCGDWSQRSNQISSSIIYLFRDRVTH